MALVVWLVKWFYICQACRNNMNKDFLIYFHIRLDQNYIFAEFHSLKYHHKYYFDKIDQSRNIFVLLRHTVLGNLDHVTNDKSMTTISDFQDMHRASCQM